MTNITRHAIERVTERFAEMGFDTDTITKTLRVLDQIAPRFRGVNVALHLFDHKPVNIGHAVKSNGDRTYAIIRNGVVVSVMQRRRTQDCSATFFRVDQVITLG